MIMKKLANLILLVLVAAAGLVTSCTDDDTTTPASTTPGLTFQVGTGYTTANATMPVSSEFKVGVRAMSSEAGAYLTKLTVTRVVNNKPDVVLDSTLGSKLTNYSVDLIANANGVPTVENWIYKITDANGFTNQLEIQITTTATSGPINEFSMKIMGAQQNSNGSSFASIDGTVYALADAKINSSKVDWMYFYGATNLATLAAPDDAAAATIFTDPTNGLQTWAVKNPTRFKLVTDPIDWASITNDEVIIAQTSSGVDQTKIPTLAPGKYLAFIASSGKKGLIKVESITGEEDGTITISVKVQQ
jgi:hypothetical protein